MKDKGRILLLSLLCVCLSLLLCFALASCKDGGEGGDGGGNGGADNGKVDYSVTVYDCYDKPISGAIVKLYRGSSMLSMHTTDAEGVCSLRLDPDDYTVEVDYIGGYAFEYDKTAAALTSDKKDLSVKLYKSVGEANISLGFAGEGDSAAYSVTDGQYMISYTAEGRTYFVFQASERGRYLITVDGDSTAAVGNYGGPHFVQNQSIVDEGDLAENGFYLDIRTQNLAGEDREASKYVIGVQGEGLSGILNIRKVEELPLDEQEIPWTSHSLEKDPAVYTLPEGVTLVDLDITDPALTVVYNSADGYYHFGTADGPVVLVKMTVATTVKQNGETVFEFPGFAKLCELTGIKCYVRDAEGNLLSKDDYTGMMIQYANAADPENGGSGVYPLTENLAEAIRLYGECNGWWVKDAENRFFGTMALLVADGKGWLFACCYAAAE